MVEPVTQPRRRTRARVTLLGIATLVVGLVGTLVVVLLADRATRDERTHNETAPGTDPHTEVATAEERALAQRRMVVLSPQAAQPQPLAATGTAGPALSLPEPTRGDGTWIPRGFPGTPEGALAQLAALNETGLAGGDPAIYGRAYRELSQDGAPHPESTGLHSVLTSFRSAAGLPAGGPVSGLRVTYQVTHGQVKGTASDGRYVVVCVLGQLAVDYQGRNSSVGVGDCQAMRRVDDGWRIAAGVLAAPAPSAWPGSADAVRAGYREVR